MSGLYQLLKVGTDAEVFLKGHRNGRAHPVIGMLGGTKHAPLPVEELGEGFFIQEDNVAAEFNTPPADNAVTFSDDIGKMHNWLAGKMSAKGYDLAIVPSMLFTPKQLDHPQAQEVGCEPDLNVWTRGVNPSPKLNPIMAKLRTASAHIHVSFSYNGEPLDPENIMVREPVVKAMDIMVGLPSIILDKDTNRRQLYGKAGAFRFKSYGIEHRVASNFWIASNDLRQWAFRGVQEAINLCNQDKGKLLRSYLKHYQEYIIDAINNQNGARAADVLARMNLGHRLNIAA